MEYLKIFPVCGLYREFYYPTPEVLVYPDKAENSQNQLDANDLFWSDILSQTTVYKIVKQASVRFSDLQAIPIPFKAIASDPEAFSARVLTAKTRVADQGLNPQDFFACVETLNIYCSLYASIVDVYTAPFTVQSGWLLREDSSETIFHNCLDEKQNPYLTFIKSVILPAVKAVGPRLVFLCGRPGYFSFAVARLLKLLNPSIFICVTRHSSEYYSMNKIDFLLTHNTYLFQAFDVIILEHFSHTEKELTDTISQNQPIQNVRNLIYRAESGDIKHNGYHVPTSTCGTPDIQRRPQCQEVRMRIAPDRVINVHLFPYAKCYWNRCNFCGINKKYHFENPSEVYSAIDYQLSELRKGLYGACYIWFVDEALPPHVLEKIATYFVQKLPCITWQARCRIEQELLVEGLPELLAASGLRELRLGLESGSTAVLKSMCKFDDGFSLSILEEICQRYSACGISIHFPIIIGFPGENDSDRRQTYDLLHHLVDKYENITFNINLFGLDIGSNVFRRWYDFDVHSIAFPCSPSFYLGNILQWENTSVNFESLAMQRDQFMREILYPWMPTRSFTPPYILYRLSETIRNTLLWKKNSLWPKYIDGDVFSYKVQTGDLTMYYDDAKDIFYIYSWNSHHFMIGNHYLVSFVNAFQTPRILQDGLNSFYEQMPNQYSIDDLRALAKRLVYDQYLILAE